ncbi:hypothetical protein AVCANL279_08375 [Campylobacter canadensis]|uniref:hypothetical protein n=1 Tax=Campylobacter canadensis TaxID=449520 RepID=UPI001555DF92|nr:hypothetical protein [Campylobacter canadensis]MBZ7995509.1 hypothetical protein [Campylobacter canadensis]MBZ7997326.1 hypothetical protein [Campylobacter canadensis]MBZ8000879.1 hypothetical protein [Campylobacter canadensis]MBZ8002679.1 hypothetical protein [Campylobacter canadensis]MBZ8003518.1 hypothetical protein [Campylobacter canadensis]
MKNNFFKITLLTLLLSNSVFAVQNKDFGEFIDIREVNGLKDNKLRMIFNARAYKQRKTVFNENLYTKEAFNDNMWNNRNYDDVFLDDVKYIQMGGLGQPYTEKNEIASSGVIGKINPIANDENIVFSLTPYRDARSVLLDTYCQGYWGVREHNRNHIKCSPRDDNGGRSYDYGSGDHPGQCLVVDKWEASLGYWQDSLGCTSSGIFYSSGDWQAAEIGNMYVDNFFSEFKNYDIGAIRAYKLEPYYQRKNRDNGRLLRNFAISKDNPEWVNNTKIEVFIENANNQYLRLPKALSYTDENAVTRVINPYNDIHMLDNTTNLKSIPWYEVFITPFYNSANTKHPRWCKESDVKRCKLPLVQSDAINQNYLKNPNYNAGDGVTSNNELEQALLYPSVFSNWNYWHINDNYQTTINYALSTFKKCKQRLLYKITISKVQLKGAGGISQLDSAFNPIAYQYYYNLYNTRLGLDETGNLASPTTPFKVQVSFADISKDPSNQVYYQVAEYTKASRPAIFFVMQGGSNDIDAIDCLPSPVAHIASAWKKNENSPSFERKNMNVGKNIYTSLEGEDVYISIDFSENNQAFLPIESYNEKRLLSIDNKSLDNFELYYDNANSKAKIINVVNDNSFSENVLIPYKALCEYYNNKYNLIYTEGVNSGACNPNDINKQGKIFFRYQNAIFKLGNLKASEEQRRKFSLEYYNSYDDINNSAAVFEHFEITVRPKEFALIPKQCAIFSKCNADTILNQEPSTESISKKLYFNKYILELNSKEFNLSFNDRIVDDTNPIEYNYGSKIINNLVIINPFDSYDIARVKFKEDHILQYIKSKGLNAQDYCIVSDKIVSKEVANTKENGKIYCQTPNSDNTNFLSVNTNNSLDYKDNIDEDARVNVVLNNSGMDLYNAKNKPFAYNIYPQIISTSKDINVAKYFSSDLLLKIKFTFDEIDDYSKLVLQANDNISPYMIRVYDENIKNNKDGSFDVLIKKDDLNKAFFDLVDYSYNFAGENLSTLDLINTKEYKEYKVIKENEAIDLGLNNLFIAQANDNHAQIPLRLFYGKKSKMFKLKGYEVSIQALKSNLSSDIFKQDTKDISFVSAIALFKDKKVKKDEEVIINKDDVWLHYIDSNSMFQAFGYFERKDKYDLWAMARNDKDKSGTYSVDCTTLPCYRLTNDEVPGLDVNTKFISDYQADIVHNTTGTHPDYSLRIKLNSSMQNNQYIKDTIHCYGGLFNCDSRWTIEFVK